MVDLDDQDEVIVEINGGLKPKARKMDRAETAVDLDLDLETDKESLRPRQNHGDGASMGGGDRDGTEVLKCTSSSFQRRQTMFRMKTRSRLSDDELGAKSEKLGKSGFLSGMMGKAPDGEDEDDPLIDDDLPEECTQSSFSIITLLQWVSLILIIAALICTVRIPSLEEKTFWDLDLWKWEVLVLVLICGRLLSGWGIGIIVFLVEWNFLLRKRVLYFVYGLRRAVQNCIWLILVFIAWHALFDERLERENDNLKYVTRVFECLLFTFVTWLLKTLMVKVMASNFHVSTYFDRIQESLFNQYVIESLSGPPLIELNKVDKVDTKFAKGVKESDLSAGRSGRVGESRAVPTLGRSGVLSQPFSKDGDIPIASLHKMNTKNVSAWSMKRLMKIVRHGALTTLDEQLMESTREDESTTMIRSEREAKAAAWKIFKNVARPGSKYIYLDDVMRFMQEEDALKTMSLFEGPSENKRISKSSLKNWLVNAFRDRRALALTLNDTKTAVNKLHNVINILVGTLIAVVWVIILGITTTDFVFFVSSQLILLGFIFGNTCRTIFEAIIFLFVIHPFDVGDRCEIDGVQMVVEEMNILTTIFLRWDNLKILYPNSVLATKHIGNFYRSPDMDDAIEFCVHVCTPPEKMALLRQKIISFMENKKEHWHPDPLFVFKNVEMLNMVRFAIWPSHTINFQNVVERWERRELVVQEMVKILREQDIQYRLLPIDINVCAMPTASSTRIPPAWALPSST